MANMKYIALLGNVNKSILQINLGNGFKIERWPIDKFVKLYDELLGDENHAWYKLDNEWGYAYGKKYRSKFVYVVIKDYDDFPNAPADERDLAQFSKYIDLTSEFQNREGKFLDDKMTKLRLCAEGTISKCIEFFYADKMGRLEMDFSSEQMHFCTNRLFKVKRSHAASINTFLGTPLLAPRHAYMRFALENFSQSYSVTTIELEFITLMIVLEALFNDGKQELRHKISRGCAVLLGRTKTVARQVHKDIKYLYDKRSVLVHTGDISVVTEADVLLLKGYARSSLRRVIELNLPKQELANTLIEAGFGTSSKIAPHKIR